MRNEHLMDYMPDYYTGDNVRDLLQQPEEQLKKCYSAQEETIDAMQPSTVRSKDASRWENEYGIIGAGLDILTRRANILAKTFRGVGTLTKGTVKDLVMLYTGQEADLPLSEHEGQRGRSRRRSG